MNKIKNQSEVIKSLLKREDISYASKVGAVHMMISITGDEVKWKEMVRFLQAETKQSYPTTVKTLKELENVGFLVKKEPKSYKCWWND